MHRAPKLDRKGLREFGVTTGIAVLAIFGLLVPWLLNRNYPIWPWILSGLLVTLGFVAPQALGPVHQGWMRFGLLMSRITTPLVLGIVYLGMVVPMGLIMRLGRRDPLARQFDGSLTSYRVASKQPSRENMEKPF